METELPSGELDIARQLPQPTFAESGPKDEARQNKDASSDHQELPIFVQRHNESYRETEARQAGAARTPRPAPKGSP